MKTIILYPLEIELNDQHDITCIEVPQMQTIELMLGFRGFPTIGEAMRYLKRPEVAADTWRDRYPLAYPVDNRYPHALCLQCTKETGPGIVRWIKGIGVMHQECWETK